jgi:hypothetical protein
VKLDIDQRTGWPEELRIFLDRYPRDVWPGHVNLGAMARFWLQIHDGFRAAGDELQSAATGFREGFVTPDRFRSWFAPRLQRLLIHLNGHHQIEDFQFFPLFSAAEPRLVKGFEVLENDHEVIHAAMDRLVENANGFMTAPADDRDRMRFTGDVYLESSEALIKLLGRHLGDEEDLIIPLILDRSEGALGL